MNVVHTRFVVAFFLYFFCTFKLIKIFILISRSECVSCNWATRKKKRNKILLSYSCEAAEQQQQQQRPQRKRNRAIEEIQCAKKKWMKHQNCVVVKKFISKKKKSKRKEIRIAFDRWLCNNPNPLVDENSKSTNERKKILIFSIQTNHKVIFGLLEKWQATPPNSVAAAAADHFTCLLQYNQRNAISAIATRSKWSFWMTAIIIL